MISKSLIEKIRLNNRRQKTQEFSSLVKQIINISSFSLLPLEVSDKKIKSLFNKDIKTYSIARGKMEDFSSINSFLDSSCFRPDYLYLQAPGDFYYTIGLVEITGYSGIREENLIKYEPLISLCDKSGDNQLSLDVFEDNSHYFYDITIIGEKWKINE